VITTEGYGGAQYWKINGAWVDQWGTQIFYSKDGGATWVQSFKYANVTPTFEQMNENGIGWMKNSSIHWSGSVAIDPFNPKQVWISSGNGVFRTEDITAYTIPDNTSIDVHGRVDPWSVVQNQVWKVLSHGIEETVPEEVVSIPGGPLISIIGDYDGFRHDDIRNYPTKRHQVSVRGSMVSLGSTRSLAYAPKKGTLVKLADARSIKIGTSMVPIWPVQISTDSGSTWSVTSDRTFMADYLKGSLAISADGEVVLWTPGVKKVGTAEVAGDYPVQRYLNADWGTAASGADGAFIVGDPVDANVFYAYNRKTGAFSKSTDKGVTFVATASTPGSSDFHKFRLAPNRTGDIWVPIASTANDGSITGKLLRSIDGGASFIAVAGVTYCEAVGFGKSATVDGYPAIYIYGQVAGVTGVFQSDDQGANWTRINDEAHEYGGLANGEFVMGDMNTYGVVYMSTAGMGIATRVPTTWKMHSTSTSAASISHSARFDGSRVTIEQGVLSLSVSSGEPLQLSVYGLDGRLLYNASFANSARLPLATLLPAQGMHVLQVQSASRVLLTRTIGHIR